MLFNEPKLLKWTAAPRRGRISARFSALQRAEIAEIRPLRASTSRTSRFSALQRAEIAEMPPTAPPLAYARGVSVLFNEPKLLKFDE